MGRFSWTFLAVAGAQAADSGSAVASSQPPPTRLRIVNKCEKEAIWIAHESGAGIGPDPQNIKIAAGAVHDFQVTDNLKATRYWPKMRCDANGNGCKLGGSGGPSETCDLKAGCGPPVDTKFEATFGVSNQPCDPSAQELAGCDWLDVSLVDGFTLPFKMNIWGDCKAKFADPAQVGKVVDCSGLTFEQCPKAENMGVAGANVDLQVHNPETGDIVGCYSPCSKLSFRNWNNTMAWHHTPGDPIAKDYCCPTPPESPGACRAGPVGKTQFVEMVHRSCPGVYGYAYDDGMGLMTCPAGTRYEVNFYCPVGLSLLDEEKEDHTAQQAEELVVVV